MRATYSIFIALSAISIPLLWFPMLLNGTLDDISEAIENNVLPDGTPLKTKYSGVSFFDNILSILVAFFYALANGSYLGARLMLADLGATLHVALGWMVVESIRNGKKPWYLSLPGLLGVLWNVAGAGIVLPLYCLIHIQTPMNDYKISVSHSISLIPAMLVSSIPFCLMIIPPKDGNYSADQHQNTIAVFQFAPLIWMAGQYTFSFLLSPFSKLAKLGLQNRSRTEISHARPRRSEIYIQAAQLFFAIYSALVHLLCVSISFFSSDPSVTILRVFIPNPIGVNRESPQRLTQAAILFLQYDWLVICLTAVLYSYLLLEPEILSTSKQARWKSTKSLLVRLLTFLPISNSLSSIIGLVAFTILLGPSTVVSLALWQCEGRLFPGPGVVEPEGRSIIKRD
ncbi:conserved hypothetical protein [Talaromyces stipitatus ATCC 10500]|uniref:Uncharacterized protein n=1 Tax=Talaromyces stipitatus (strain ATCC 10500 / CBS 375.48 / QM 6759 / NRRL 1006) TaxID=441959 RepID=B8M9X7_TALSN|nr:uncharacterized protein TSTA_118930 [Talaromyces stipitatus ATCC 10500]EED18129.1 conserved hypothetical protein [Talaromyces stipitatus ATCC 10500]